MEILTGKSKSGQLRPGALPEPGVLQGELQMHAAEGSWVSSEQLLWDLCKPGRLLGLMSPAVQ